MKKQSFIWRLITSLFAFFSCDGNDNEVVVVYDSSDDNTEEDVYYRSI